MNRVWLFLIISFFAFSGCENSSEQPVKYTDSPADTFACCKNIPVNTDSAISSDPIVTTGAIPVLCYHQIRDWTSRDTKSDRVYIMPVATFKEQMQMLHDSGYHTILPDQLIAYMENGGPLPSRPVLLTFDDADESQYTVALPELDKAGFKGVFFIMTVVLGHPNYMGKEQVKDLAAQGHIIGCHTWDHHMVTKYTGDDWLKQIEKPKAELEQITGMPVRYFAYPYGLWNDEAVQQLRKYGFTAAFQLTGKQDKSEPLFTITRQIVDGNWSAARMLKVIYRKEEEKKPVAGRPLSGL